MVSVVRAGVKRSVGLDGGEGGGSTPGNMCPLLVHPTTAPRTQTCGKVKVESSLGAMYRVCVMQANITTEHKDTYLHVYLHLE
jgi:hypothetical protein